MEIYVGFESPSIIQYLEPLTADQFQARFVDYHFNETILGERMWTYGKEIGKLFRKQHI